MFESAELGHRISKSDWKKTLPSLRESLLEAQFDLLESKSFSVLVLISGVEGAGKGDTVRLLNEWMDPRHIVTHGFVDETPEESERPDMWRFWRALPPKGKIGIMFGSWYTRPIVSRVYDQTSAAELSRAAQRIRHMERMLANEQVLLVKLWFHLSKKKQKNRLNSLAKDPETKWRVTKADWKAFEHFDRFKSVSEEVLRETSTGNAPWVVIDGSDQRYRSLTAGSLLLGAMRDKLATQSACVTASAPLLESSLDQRNVLNELDYTMTLDKPRYRDELQHWQREIGLMMRDKRFRKRSLICVFEGNDAAGKGGAIRRVVQAIDPRYYEIVPVAAPTQEELAQPYLWRFWRHLPRQGRALIFDRSWYGRVLVERVEGLCTEYDWMRSYEEINEFEEQLVENGSLLAKFWLAITAEEQLKRFKAREESSYKRFKITEEDWRNREKWHDYEKAVCDMVDRTSTSYAPWALVEANCKRHARIAVLRNICELWEQRR